MRLDIDFFFFFKQKTAYEMRISDWSSDVCSFRSVWKLAGLDGVRPLLTTFTVGADDPGVMAGHAAAFAQARALKLKLTGDADLDAARVRAVRARCPDPWIGVDANQGPGAATLPALLPALVAERVSLLDRESVGSGKRVSVRVDHGGR